MLRACFVIEPSHLVGVGFGVLGALIVASASFYIWRKRKQRVRTLLGTLVVSSTTPRRLDMTSERALQRLLEIEQSGVLVNDDTRKGGYAEMVAVIREYLGGRYHVATLDLTTAELMRSNRIQDPRRLRIGQMLMIPIPPGTPLPAGVQPPAAAVVARGDSPKGASKNHHVLAEGETLSEVAVRHGVSVDELLRLNRIEDPRRVRAGTRLRLR